MKRKLHAEAIYEIRDIKSYLFDSGDEYFAAMSQAATNLPAEPFLQSELEELMAETEKEYSMECVFIIFAKGNHREILPWMARFLQTTKRLDLQLSTAAAMAKLGDEAGYQFIEDLFQRYMNKENDMEDFDFESFVLIFEEILTNDRGREMLRRFRDEANYQLKWRTLEQPDFD